VVGVREVLIRTDVTAGACVGDTGPDCSVWKSDGGEW
jgi:hypothetical protein